MDRPALQRLLADIEAGQVDCVVVYKVDRLSRSLLDFARMMETFEQHKVVLRFRHAAVQHGDSAWAGWSSTCCCPSPSSSARSSPSAPATRSPPRSRKGKWAGGRPLLGYDVDPRGGRLLVNADEAQRVRAIFALYLEHGALLPVVQELERRGWTNKRWRTAEGPGARRPALHQDRPAPAADQRGLRRQGALQGRGPRRRAPGPRRSRRLPARAGAAGRQRRHRRPAGAQPARGAAARAVALRAVRLRHDAVAGGQGGRRYRYYTCVAAQKRGWHTCPSKSVPAAEIEALVVEQVRGVGRDPALLREVLARRVSRGRGGRRSWRRRACAWSTT